ncbi:SDR family oxidoreductase [Amycolatopsis acidiphila]|uniref:SDR family NAD(P)-dependent oxidoreductase n=1 Tax=Amycolatopsis acidiphila TaxID=715473 RepID=UPI001643ED0B|nr:SDR family oxidoreductase [Amycolatopsis acidiphila]UIJ62520.1 SDR family oxidoreductase [Amycolatopsis acidiphila]
MSESLFSLQGTVAVVTGGARGIGKAAARALAEHGAGLLLVDRLEAELASTAAELAETGAAVDTLLADITADDIGERIRAAAIEAGPVGVVVNAAGVMVRSAITELTVAELDTLWRVNVRGTVEVTQALLPQLIERGYGKIINVGSLGSVRGLERRTGYATSKGAVAQYTVSLASEAGAYGIRANVVAPGYVATDMASPWIYGDADRTERLRARIPLGQFATPADLAGTFVFLAAPASDYVTGQILLVDGGWTTT